ncbi:ATP-binding protein [Microbispora amethystogenes]|uniref:Uncharacterized protein n=1 Tax=Microbispora amethystogenes TaxID=1427754 RepID=A0ABQ4F869_9ACTN|nr:ATP-binding protein [Microbispora amethystogenes]GIH31003.1 hypothetical protein Mam01_11670 [Microbispora amethystogenes]
MAGTLIYRLHVAHIYQRRFDLAGLAEALKSSHWYLITRRPAVKLVAGSFRCDDHIITADFVTHDSTTGIANVHTLGVDVRGLGELSDFQDYADGSYFSFRAGERLIHGDSWALASLMAEAQGDISKHEVLYAGQAFGVNASSNAYERTLAHKKLQRIYEDHVDSGYEIFVVPLSWSHASFFSDDHIDDVEDGPDMQGYYDNFLTLDGQILQASVDLIEHSIISHFAPHYNQKLKEWRTSRPTDAMRKMRSAGFRLLHVHLSGWHGLARFFSPLVPAAHRSHLISQDLPPVEFADSDVLRGISAKEISNWRFGAYLLREGQDIVANLAENSGAAMRIFGDEAPTIRKPPGVKLSQFAIPVDASNHDAIRSEINEARELERKAEEPLPHPGVPTYDPSKGTIEVGEYQDGTRVYLQLHDPAVRGVNSVLIVGDPGMGKSNALWVLMVEAYASGIFDVIPVDPSNSNDLASIGDVICPGLPIAASVDDAVRVLQATLEVVSARREDGGYGIPTVHKPGLFIAIDDADELLLDERGSALIRELLSSGPDEAVGLMLVVADISAVEEDQALMRALMACPSRFVFMPNGNYVMADLMARCGAPRLETWNGESITLILRIGRSDVTVGLIIGMFDPDMDLAEVKASCATHLEQVNRPIVMWEDVENPERWRAWDINGRELSLSKHDDAWILVVALSTTSIDRLERVPDAIKWATGVFEYRFDGVLLPWQTGPTVEGVTTLYANIEGEIVPKNNTLESQYRFLIEHFHM